MWKVSTIIACGYFILLDRTVFYIKDRKNTWVLANTRFISYVEHESDISHE